MISRVEALGFRSLRYVAQELKGFQVLVGPNGSGKSGFLDVVSLLGDILRVGPLRAIVGDSTLGIAPRASDASHLCFMRSSRQFELAVELNIPEDRLRLLEGSYARARYEVAIHVGEDDGEVRIAAETLWLKPPTRNGAQNGSNGLQRVMFPDLVAAPPHVVREERQATPSGWRKVVHKIGESGNDYFRAETSGWNNPFRLGPTKSALANLPEDESRFPVATWVKRVLMEGVHRVALSADAMRAPSPPGAPRRFQPDGSNLPWAVERLRTKEPTRFQRWLDHVRTALPEIRGVETVEREEDRHRYLIIEYGYGLRAPSWIVSDGTLRLLALTLLAYLPEHDGAYLIEEPENGIHPRAIETVYQALSAVYDAQVLCASHSPVVLGLASPDALLCFARHPSGATDIVGGAEHPRLREWKGSLDLGTLFAAGVLG